jgi:hypothetical protein
MYLPGIITPSVLPSSVIPVFSLADHANNAMWQNLLPPGITPAEYAYYMSRITNGMIGSISNHDAGMHHLNQPHPQNNHDAGMHHLNQPHPQNLDMSAYQYHQMNCYHGGDNPFPPKPK